MEKRYFGTDGIRGLVGSHPITPEFMLKLGWAAGNAFRNNGHCRVVIGKDTRVSGYMFESALEAGLSAAGAQVQLLGPMPTPAIAYLTRTFQADAGIVISASHNPHYDNGIKFFSSQGTKLADTLEHEIERLVDSPMQLVEASQLGKVARVEDASGRYIEFCKSSVPTSTSFKGMKIVLDCAHGATYKVAPSVFRELGATVSTIGVTPDGLNINDGVGSTNLKALSGAVVEQQADLGIAFDGDGDRVEAGAVHEYEASLGHPLRVTVDVDQRRRTALRNGAERLFQDSAQAAGHVPRRGIVVHLRAIGPGIRLPPLQAVDQLPANRLADRPSRQQVLRPVDFRCFCEDCRTPVCHEQVHGVAHGGIGRNARITVTATALQSHHQLTDGNPDTLPGIDRGQHILELGHAPFDRFPGTAQGLDGGGPKCAGSFEILVLHPARDLHGFAPEP